ncbi:MAG: hypothetical protein FWG65_10220 [Turicibacter sp.]|nr:hypothetical protein [Turicibacter sp.]
MKLIEEIKLSLRVLDDEFTPEIAGLVDACYADLRTAGVRIAKKHRENPHPLLKQAATLYAKAHFGADAAADRYLRYYEGIKIVLSLAAVFTGKDEKDEKDEDENV